MWVDCCIGVEGDFYVGLVCFVCGGLDDWFYFYCFGGYLGWVIVGFGGYFLYVFVGDDGGYVLGVVFFY